MVQLKTIYQNAEEGTVSPREILCNAIILQAVRDLRKARKRLKRRPDDRQATAEVKEITHFFCSEYFTSLTRVDGPTLLRRLLQEAS